MGSFPGRKLNVVFLCCPRTVRGEPQDPPPLCLGRIFSFLALGVGGVPGVMGLLWGQSQAWEKVPPKVEEAPGSSSSVERAQRGLRGGSKGLKGGSKGLRGAQRGSSSPSPAWSTERGARSDHRPGRALRGHPKGPSRLSVPSVPSGSHSTSLPQFPPSAKGGGRFNIFTSSGLLFVVRREQRGTCFFSRCDVLSLFCVIGFFSCRGCPSRGRLRWPWWGRAGEGRGGQCLG